MSDHGLPGAAPDGLSEAGRALLRRLAGPRRLGKEPVAVVGMACRLPGADSLDAFWELLRQGTDAVGPAPRGRRGFGWPADSALPCTLQGGFLQDVASFDADFFGISPREAAAMDPQHRLLLEVSWHALEDAGLSRAALAGTRTGVFFSVYQRDYALAALSGSCEIDAYTTSGTHHSIAANRLSYLLDLRGPSLAIDTACSSSLVAVHQACRGLLCREVDRAIVGGANLILRPQETESMARWGMLDQGGRCRTFDASAGGFVRGEGCGVVVLERLADAAARRQAARAVILGSAVNQDGATNGLTAPSPAAQEAVIRAALADAGLPPSRVGYVEAHGTGTRLGDPVELAALSAALDGEERHPGCLVGAVKTNIGHLEAAAGVAGLIKAALVVSRGAVPPTVHFRRLNPAVQLAGAPLEVAASLIPWPTAPPERVAGVSAFGMGGTNAHVVLRGPASQEEAPSPESPGHGDGPCLLPLSAGDPAALAALARAHAGSVPRGVALHRRCAAAARLTHHPFRLGLVARNQADLHRAVEQWRAEGARSAPAAAPPGGWHGVVFVFSGQGSQWPGMGLDLLASEPVFASSLRRCDAALRRQEGWSLLEALEDAGHRGELQGIEVVQPLIFAMQVSLARLWRHWGLEPDAVVGHSMGEAAAAHVAGALSLEDALSVVACRSRLMGPLRGTGAMVAVGLSEEQAARAVAGHEAELSVAVVNGPASTVLSGDARAMARLVADLEACGVLCQPVAVDVASHNPAMDALGRPLEALLAHLAPRPGTVPIWSTVTGQALAGDALDAGYWIDNLRRPVRFWDAAVGLLEQGHGVFLEVSPHPILLPALRDGLSGTGRQALLLGSGRRNEDQRERLLEAAARLFERGVPLDWEVLCPGGGGRVDLPPYPFQRRRHWLSGWSRATDRTGASEGKAPMDERRQQRALGWMYEEVWQPAPGARPAAGAGPAAWRLLPDRGGLAQRLAAGLEAAGLEVQVGGEPRDRLAHLLALSPLDAVARPGAPVAEAAALALDACWSLVELARRLGPGQRLWVLTRGAAGPAGHQNPLQACLWGLAAALRAELAPGVLRLLDLDPEDIRDDDASVQEILSVLTSGEPEDRWALRRGALLVPRLRRAAALQEAGPAVSLPLRPDSAYLVAGGLGALGLEVAGRLARRGARHLVLLGRSPPPPRSSWRDRMDSGEGGPVRGLLALEALGAAVHVEPLDIADEARVDAFFRRWRAESRPPVRGAIHAAGMQRPAALQAMRRPELKEELDAKVAGTLALWRTLGQDLDFFGLFSSAATLLDSPMLGGYSAASAFLDAFALGQREGGCPVTAVDWGVWGEAGMARRYEERTGRQLTGGGVHGMPTEAALDALELALAGEAGRLGVFSMDWQAWCQGHPVAAGALYLSGVAEPAEQARLVGGVLPPAADLALLPGEDRTRRMAGYLRARLGRVLRAPGGTEVPMDRPLTRLGLDSLMAMELKTCIEADTGIVVSLVDLLTCQAGDLLADHLTAALHGGGAGRDGEWEEYTI